MPVTNKVFDFKTQLEVGSRGEALFLEYYPEKISIWPERDGDFITETGEKIELKSDDYNMEKTSNFFIERYSDFDKKTPGSLWQADGHGCSRFVYYFVRHNTWFEFRDIPALMSYIEKHYGNKGFILIKNKGWRTAGWKIPREELKQFFTEYTFTLRNS